MKQLQIIQAELRAPKNQYNTFGKYSYRSCEDILEGVKPLLLKTMSTLIMTDEIINVGSFNYIKSTVTLRNQDGEEVSSTGIAREAETQKGMNPAQITGSTSSYSRKYALNGLFAIDDAKDDDTRPPAKETPASKTPPPVQKKLPTAEELVDLCRIGYAKINEPSEGLKTWLDQIEDHPVTELASGLKRIKNIIKEQTK